MRDEYLVISSPVSYIFLQLQLQVSKLEIELKKFATDLNNSLKPKTLLYQDNQDPHLNVLREYNTIYIFFKISNC